MPDGQRVPQADAIRLEAMDARGGSVGGPLPLLRRKLDIPFWCETAGRGSRFTSIIFILPFRRRSKPIYSPPRCAHWPGVPRSMKFWEASSGDLLHRLLYTDIKTYLVELLMKQDQMSMAASIESRVPFLDHVLVEFALNIPASHKTRGLTGKRILKAAMKKSLPDAILNRQKLGFPTPYSQWLSGPQIDTVKDLLSEERTVNRGLFKSESVERLFAEHRTNLHDHSDKLSASAQFGNLASCLYHRDPEPLDIPAARHSLASG